MARDMDAAAPPRAAVPMGVVLTLGVLTLVAAQLTVIGSDALWLSALGDEIRRTAAIPTGIPFAAADSATWVNTTVLGQLLFSFAYTLGSVGVVVAQVVAVMLALAAIALDSSARGAGAAASSAALVLVALGAAAPLLIARAQLLSLLPYVVLLALLRRQHARPSAGIWWTVPLVAVWGNLHGAVLAGVAVLGCYLLFSRLRHSPATAVGVGLAALAATCLNPGLLEAPRYYLGVFSGHATRDDSGMWSRLSLTNPLDVLLVVGALALVFMAARHRRPAWEYVAALGLAGATVTAARHGIWLMLFLAVPAALGWLRGDKAPPRKIPSRTAKVAVAALLAGAAAVILVLRAPTFRAADDEAAALVGAAKGHVVLVAEPLAESLAAAGAKVWISNPLDAFAGEDQAAYLAFMAGDALAAKDALRGAEVVIAEPGSPQAALAESAGMSSTARTGAYDFFSR